MLAYDNDGLGVTGAGAGVDLELRAGGKSSGVNVGRLAAAAAAAFFTTAPLQAVIGREGAGAGAEVA